LGSGHQRLGHQSNDLVVESGMAIIWWVIAKQHDAIVSNQDSFQASAKQFSHPTLQLMTSNGSFDCFSANHNPQATNLGGTGAAAPWA